MSLALHGLLVNVFQTDLIGIVKPQPRGHITSEAAAVTGACGAVGAYGAVGACGAVGMLKCVALLECVEL